MDDSMYRASVLRFIVFCFFYLQFCAAMYLYVYWARMGVDPSGYFSFHDLLAITLSKSINLSILFLVYGALTSVVPFAGHAFRVNNELFCLLLIPVSIAFIFPIAKYVPYNSGGVYGVLLGFVVYALKFPIELMAKQSGVYNIFGGQRSAFVYIFIVVVGLVWSIPSAVRHSSWDFDNPGPSSVTVSLKGKLVSHPLVNRLGQNFVVATGVGSVVVIPYHEVKSVTYYSKK